jgi:long-chain acyl-CoA synthetase
MALLKKVKTIPELFEFLVDDYGKNLDRPIMKRKVDGVYKGISYAEFKEETEALACGLAAMGIKRDDKVTIISENRPEWIYADMAIIGIGAVNVPLYPSLTADSIKFILNNSESKGVIVSNKFQLNKILKIKDECSFNFIIVMNEKDLSEENGLIYSLKQIKEKGEAFRAAHPGFLKESIKKINPEDLCTIIYTSGTTGEPKGVMLNHRNILSNVTAALEIFPIEKEDIFLSFLPLCHIFERMAGYYTGFASGGMICFAESIETVAQNLSEIKPTIMTAVPRLFERMYSKIIKNVESQSPVKQKIFYWAMDTGTKFFYEKKSGNKISPVLAMRYKIADKLVYSKLKEKVGGNLRFFISGGAALPREIGVFFESIGIIIVEGYGLTESSPVISANRLEEYKFGTVGKPFPGVQIKIAPDGEILAKGPNIMLGYYKNKKETDAIIKDGWLYTGDIGLIDSDGFLVITDRKKHLFKTSAGKYIAPTPIENLITASRYVEQFVLIGDNRTFLSGLIVPDFDALIEYAHANNIAYESTTDLITKKEIYDFYEKELSLLQKKLANFEKIRKFVLLDKTFSIETGELTPSLKVKRKIVEERYAHLIEDMYTEAEINKSR